MATAPLRSRRTPGAREGQREDKSFRPPRYLDGELDTENVKVVCHQFAVGWLSLLGAGGTGKSTGRVTGPRTRRGDQDCVAAVIYGLLEEVHERRVIEQVFRFDGLNLAGNRIWKITWRRPMTSPARYPTRSTWRLIHSSCMISRRRSTLVSGRNARRSCGSYRRSGSNWLRMKLAYSLNGCMATSRFSTNMPARVEPALSLV